MSAKIIPCPIAAAPPPALTEEILLQADALAKLFTRLSTEMLNRLIAAESAAIERLNDYVPHERLLTSREAAVYLGYSKRCVDNWTAPGRAPLIQFTMLGGEKRFRKEWLDEAINKGVVRPKEIRLP